MILAGVLYATLTGNLEAVTNGIFDSAKEAVMLCITMLGAISFWTGMMNIAQEAKLVELLTIWIQPLLRFLFPRLENGGKAQEYIALNCISNFLGLGWAATPAGLLAMEELAKVERKRQGIGENEGIVWASDEMCTFLVLNISSLQLLPMNIIAYRVQYGSVKPAGIVGAAIVATTLSSVMAVIYCKLRQKKET